MKKLALAGACAAAAMFATPALAATYSFTFVTNQALLGGIQTGSGTFTTSDTLTTSPLGTMGYQVTGITGTLNGSAINGLSGFQGSDNFYYTSGNFVDNSGIGFTTVGGTSASLYFASTVGRYQLTTTSPFSTGYVTATSVALAAAVPEPATWVLMILGFGAIGFTMRRPRQAVRLAYSG
jgi:hypothetical protein